jgi:predicted nucleotidyltransferase
MSEKDVFGNDQVFNKLARPIRSEDDIGEVRDAEFYVRKDGLIVNAEGWYHPPHMLVGEVLYAPDETGDKTIFGQAYRKVSLYPGTYSPVPYADRGRELTKYDPSLDQQSNNPFFAKYKQIFPRSDFIAHLPSRDTLHKVLTELALPGDDILYDLENLQKLLGLDLSELSLGLTGAPLLGNYRGYHDLDLVFQGTVSQNLDIAKRMRELVKYEPHRRLVEGGKGWNIRFFNDRQKLMCNFFGYMSPSEAPLIDFEMDVMQDNMQFEGTVDDDAHSMYTPTILGLNDIIVTEIEGTKMTERYNDLPLIVYHTATRGECFKGDRVRARGALVQVKTPNDSYEAICAVEREAVRNLTPTWEGFYEDGSA